MPLTLADVYLRDEQLPFAYAFRDTLDSDRLISSLKEVLRRYPILGATADFSLGKRPTLECNINNFVPISFGKSDLTLDQWLEQEKSGRMQHTGWQSGGGGGPGAPTLSPLFDDLLSAKWERKEGDDIGSKDQIVKDHHHIVTIRITYFRGAGTAIGINFSHMLGDANSCFRICQVWGRAMRGLDHPLGASNDRAKATLTGMVSPEMTSLLNLSAEKESWSGEYSEAIPFYNEIAAYFDELIGVGSTADDNQQEADLSERNHEYARLELSDELLQAMKSYGMNHCSMLKPPNQAHEEFVSTNDMITAMGWLIKRRIAEKLEWNLSMVVNLRNRGGIDDFGCIKDSSVGTGVFGNALTSVVAKLPPSTNQDITMTHVCNAAIAIRQSLIKKMAKVEDMQYISRSGGGAVQGSNQGACFSSTSWMQFSLWDISFGTDSITREGGRLSGFYGRPSYPLPVGDTYSSINVPGRKGGCTYKLLAPTRRIQSILALHESISKQFLNWAREEKNARRVKDME